ncbi:hypothetical protein [Reinekea sp.]|jgi:hypothetical protein|uniref:hypothetical protein n=1 Tax=Reinekea sp. TaxID=1970455 RepID=UPI003988A1A9
MKGFQIRLLLAVPVAAVFLSGCGPQGSDGGSTGGGLGGGGSSSKEYCSENYPDLSSSEGNVYVFDVAPMSCLGLVESPALKKEVPFTITAVDDSDLDSIDPKFQIDSTIKLLLRKSGVNFSGYDLYASIKMTNQSETDYCYDPEDIVFKDSAGALLPKDTSDSSNAGGALFHTKSRTTFRCLPSQQTHYFITNGFLVTEDMFNDIHTASMASLELERPKLGYLDATKAPVLSMPAMQWLNPGKRGSSYPTLSVTWTNNTGSVVKLDDNSHKVWLMDDDGYAVSWMFVYLEDALGKDREDLVPEDYLILPGATVTLEDDAADNAAVMPSSATQARVYLDWLAPD